MMVIRLSMICGMIELIKSAMTSTKTTSLATIDSAR